MKFLIVVLMLIGVGSSFAQTDDKQTVALNQYEGDLEKMLVKFKKNGNRESSVIVEKELNRFRVERTVTTSDSIYFRTIVFDYKVRSR